MKTLFVIGHTLPEPTTTAAGERMMQLLRFFSDQGYEINFGSLATANERSASLESHSIVTHSLQLNDVSFDALLKGMTPDIVLFDRYITEEQFGWRVAEVCPDAIRILDTEDLHFLRKAREEALKKGKTADEANLFSETAKRELACILRSDLSLIISDMEMELLRNTFRIPEGLLLHLPFLIEEGSIPMKDYPEFHVRKNFITIGNFRHTPNSDSVQWLAKEIWPRIRKQLPQAELHVYGNYAPKKISELHNKEMGFLLKGWTPEVNEVMLAARVCLAPLRFGAGLKGKIVDAMMNGTPVVTTSMGAEGINGDLPFGGRITDTVEGIVAAAVQLYTLEKEWQQCEKNAYDILKKRFNRSVFTHCFDTRLQELQKDLEEHRNANFLGQILQYHTLKATKYMSKWIELKNRS